MGQQKGTMPMLTHDFVSKRKGYILSALINILFCY